MSWIVRFLNGQIEQFHTMHFYNVTLLCVFLQIIINTKQWCSFKCIIYKSTITWNSCNSTVLLTLTVTSHNFHGTQHLPTRTWWWSTLSVCVALGVGPVSHDVDSRFPPAIQDRTWARIKLRNRNSIQLDEHSTGHGANFHLNSFIPCATTYKLQRTTTYIIIRCKQVATTNMKIFTN